jgi:osmoprotectant transport system permease protein
VLFLLAVPPILTNTYVATRQVDRNTVDAARGIGMSEAQIISRVELPLGLATMFGGIRTSTVNVVATATIAPLASVKTLGYPIININVYGFSGTLGAAIVVAILTLALDGALAYVQRAVTPRGIKIRAGGGGLPRRGRFLASVRTPREGQVT